MRVRDTKAASRHWGAPAGPDADTVHLLHCSLAQGAAWAGCARALPRDLSITAPDLVGHGAAPDRDPARDYHDQATEAAATHLPDRPCHLVGHSLGATIALRLALDQPHRVRSLTLIEPVLFCAADGPSRAAHDADFAPIIAALARGDAAEATHRFTDIWGGAPFDSLPAAARAYMTARIWVAPATEPALVADRAGLLPRLPDLSVPCLLLQGAACPPVIDEINTRLARDLPKARRATIPGAGHMAPLTHSGPTAHAIAAFLACH